MILWLIYLIETQIKTTDWCYPNVIISNRLSSRKVNRSVWVKAWSAGTCTDLAVHGTDLALTRRSLNSIVAADAMQPALIR
mgnify:FL=1